ncbi:hypothetical protein NE237_026170 [Protea cynaroides]|uniref:Uncharacterized protein n=1 Tax=Protea cynaroides TaxID=273540 RepID=A0A9Q0K089_9MAGN|nr:hypothetical protein NE237_026170 [Protea cynaroides]
MRNPKNKSTIGNASESVVAKILLSLTPCLSQTWDDDSSHINAKAEITRSSLDDVGSEKKQKLCKERVINSVNGGTEYKTVKWTKSINESKEKNIKKTLITTIQ